MILSTSERKRLAVELRVSEQYLYQCLTGRRDMDPVEAVRIERESSGAVTRFDLCRKRGAQIWPELAPPDGASQAHPVNAYTGPDRRDPNRISPYAGTDIDRRAAAGEG